MDDLFPGSHLCSIGTYANFNYNPATLTWTWTCNGAVGTTPAQCSAKKKTTPQPQPVEPKCNSNYAGQTHYNHNYPVAWLNASMPLCKPGTVFAFQGPNEKGYYQRGCKLLGFSTEGNACQAKEQWCGDGIVQFDYEECDPNAPTQIPGKICTLACKLQDKPIYDLALTKTLVNFSVAIQSGDQNIGQPSYFMPGDPVKFRITVYNQGNLPAKNIQVTEYIPRGLLLDDSYWKQEGNLATRWIKDTILP